MINQLHDHSTVLRAYLVPWTMLGAGNVWKPVNLLAACSILPPMQYCAGNRAQNRLMTHKLTVLVVHKKGRLFVNPHMLEPVFFLLLLGGWLVGWLVGSFVGWAAASPASPAPPILAQNYYHIPEATRKPRLNLPHT